MRALQEFQKLVRTHLNRVTFIMLYKLALQMNLQLTFIIIWRIQQSQSNVSALPEVLQDIINIDAVGFFSIASLSLTFGLELFDVICVVLTFWKVRRAVKGEVTKLGNSGSVYATHDFITDEDKSLGRTVHSGRDLKADYYTAWRTFCRMLLITSICMWLIGYAVVKFVFAELCPHRAWSYAHGCLTPPV